MDGSRCHQVGDVKLLKKIVAVIIALVLLFCLSVPAFAISQTPDTIALYNCEAYNNVLDTGDMYFIIRGEVEYTVTPTESIGTTYVVRFMDTDGVTEIASKAPSIYFDNGWDMFVTGFYFTAAEVTSYALTWAGAYSIRLDGNPTASWAGSPIPSAAPLNSFMWNNGSTPGAQQIVVSNKVLGSAVTLQSAWASSSYTLYQSVQGIYLLTAQGTTYFGEVLPYMTLICNSILTTFNTEAELVDHTATGDTQTGIINFFNGSIFDISALGTQWGLPNQLLSSVLALALILVAIVGISRKINSYKPAVLLMFPMLLAFTLIGWIPVVVAVFLGFIAIVGVAYIFLLEKSSY